MGRTPCCQKVGLKKGRWTAEEDDILAKYIQANGEGSWRSLPKNAGLLRCGKSCRLRWINYLRADLKRGNITAEEEETIIKLHASLGSRWSFIASILPGRTDNEIKNYWNSHLRRKIHTFLRPSSEKIEPVVLVVGETTKKNADKTVRKAAVKKKKKKSRMTQIQEDGDNITDVNMNGPVADSNICNNVSTERNEHNVNAVSTVDDEDVVPLPATPTFEKETYNLASTESMEDCLDMGMEQEETGVLCSEVKQTDVLGPFEGIDEEMLSLGDIIDNDPNGVWSSTNLMDGVTENNVLAGSDDLSNSGTANGERAELRSCPSVSSLFDESKFDLDLDFDWDWDWKSVIQGPDQQLQQQLEENDQNVLSWAWDKSCESEDEKEKEKHNAMVAWLLS